MRKLLKPKASAEDIARILKEDYCENEDDSCEVIQELESYDDNNFLVSISGVKYLLKVSESNQ